MTSFEVDGYMTKAKSPNSFKCNIDIILICIIGLLSILWFQGDHLIARFDFWFPDDGIQILSEIIYTWQSSGSFGTSNFKGLASITYGFYLLITENIIDLSAVNAEKIFFYIIFTSSGLSMYYLSSVIGLEKRWRLIPSLFYMFNPFFISHFKIFSAYSFTPLLLGLFIVGLDKKYNLKYIIYFALVWFISSSYMFIDPGYTIMLLTMYFLYLTFYFIKKNNVKSLVHGIKFSSTLLIILFFMNIFWILPTILGLDNEFSKMHSGLGEMSNTELFNGLSGNLIDTLHLLGYGKGNLAKFWKDEPYFQWASWYFQTSTRTIGLIIPIIVFLPLIFLKKFKNKSHIYYFSILTIIGIFCVTGTKPPFVLLKSHLWSNIPLYTTIFRNPLKLQLIITIGYSILLGFGAQVIYKNLFKNRSKLIRVLFFISLVLTLFVYYPLPFWNGTIFSNGGEVTPSERVTIPNYYYNARAWFSNNSHENIRILTLPMSTNYQAAYEWEYGYYGVNPDRYLLRRATISNDDNSEAYKLVHILGQEISNGFLKLNLNNYLGLLNIQYILLHGDANWKFINSITQSQFYAFQNFSSLNSMLNKSDLNHSKFFGPVTLFEVDKQVLLPRIYSSSNPIYINSDKRSLNQITNTDIINQQPVFFFSEDQNASKLLNCLDESWKTHIKSIYFNQIHYKHDFNNIKNIKIYNTYFLTESLQKEFYIPNISRYNIKQIVYGTYIPQSDFIKVFDAKYFHENKWTNGALVEDSEASSGKAIYNGGTTGPYSLQYYPPGKYKVIYYLKTDNNIPDSPLIDLVVSKQGTGESLLKTTIKHSDFKEPNIYQPFSLPLSLFESDANRLEFKVGFGGYHQSANLWIDNITVIRIERKIDSNNFDKFEINEVNYPNNVFDAKFIYNNNWTNGDLVEDSQTDSGKAIYNGYTVGPYTFEYYPSGLYNVTYSLKIDNNTQNLPFIDLVVSKKGSGEPLAKRRVHASNFNMPYHYQSFTLPLTILESDAGWLEFKLGYGGYKKITNLWINNISIIRVDKIDNFNKNSSKSTIKLPRGHYNLTINVSENSFFLMEPTEYNFTKNSQSVSFQKINPTKYNVHIENATEPFFLIFSESFHPEWKAYPEDKDMDFNDIIAHYPKVKVKEARHQMSFTPKDIFYLLKEPLSEDNHFTANGFANSWYIDPKEFDKDKDGNFNLTLYFKPQSYFYLGLIISLTTFILCIIYLIYDWRKNRKKEYQVKDNNYSYEFTPKKQKYSYNPKR